MEKPTRRTICILSVVIGMIVFAWCCRMFGLPYEGGSNPFRSAIYAVLFIYWGFTLKRRLIHPQARRYGVEAAAFLVFWHLVRTVKYTLQGAPLNLIRYLWYLYYVPMLLVTTLTFLIILTIGMPETKRLSHKTALLFCMAGTISLLVLTNDLHQLAFAFPDNSTVWTDSDYSYGIVYYLAAAYLILCSVAMFVTMVRKADRRGSSRLILIPCIPAVLLLGYFGLYDLRTGWIFKYFGDMTSVSCVLYAATVELCIQCGFIGSNTGYRALFLVSGLGAQILDHAGNVCLASENAMSLTREQIASAADGTAMIGKTVQLKSKPISFGTVLWQEDVSALTEAIEESEENLRELAERSRIQQESLQAGRDILALQENNRASDLLHHETAGQLALIDRLLSRYSEETNEAEKRRLLAGAAVVGAYIKRYGNLLLVQQRTEDADIADLVRCFEESFSNLELLNVECLCSLPQAQILLTKDMLRVYSAFEAVLEDCLFGLKHVWIHGRERSGQLLVYIEIVCDAELSRHAALADAYAYDSDSGTARFNFQLQRGGAAG